MAENSKPKYQGVLGKPIELRNQGLFEDDADFAERIEREHERQFQERVDALFAYFGVEDRDDTDPTKWMHVALGLAARHVKGFASRMTTNESNPKGGAKQKWDQFRALNYRPIISRLKSVAQN
jgi:hypothetical protein